MNYISGSSGFIGSHLQKRIQATPIPHGKIASFALEPFDNFFFLSSYGNLINQQESKKIVKANIIDVFSIIEQAVKHYFNSFVFISTSSVKLRTQTMYSRSKRAAEELLLSYMEKYNKPICIIRPYSVTGVGEQQTHLIPTLIRSCMTGELINFVPNATHDFIDVEDVVEGMLNLSQNKARGIYELGTGTSYSNDQIRVLVEKATGKKANINIVSSMRDYDNDSWVSTNFRSRGYGWMPKKSIADSIKSMVKAYEQTKKKNT